jgi:hypothetical protein
MVCGDWDFACMQQRLLAPALFGFLKGSSSWWIGIEGLLYSEAELLFRFANETTEDPLDAVLASVNSVGACCLIVKQPHHLHDLLQTGHNVVCYNSQRSLMFRSSSHKRVAFRFLILREIHRSTLRSTNVPNVANL